ncbi:MAG: ABC transporter substrate-binding protein [Candidatus Bipolaricaulaceae bacterium]
MRTSVLLALAAVIALGVAGLAQVEITFWHAMGSAHGPILEKLVASFMEENPDIVVDLVYQGGYGSLEQKLFAAVAAGNPPTIAQQYENVTTQWLDALAPLEDYMDPQVIDDLVPHMREANTFQGVFLTAPFNKSIIVLYYRPDLVPEPPTTWEEFLQMSCDLTVDEDGDGTIDLYGTGLRPPNPEIFLTFLAQNGGALLNEDWTEVIVNNQAGVETAEFAAQLADCALVQGGYLSAPFRDGLIAMFVDTSAGYPYNLGAAQAGGFPMEVAMVPGKKNRTSMVQGTNLGVFALGQTEEQIQAAARLVEFLLRADNIVYWAKESGYLPVTKTGIESEEWVTYCEQNPERQVMTDQFLMGFSQIHHPNYSDFRNAMITYYELLLLGDLGPQEAMDALADELEYYLYD